MARVKVVERADGGVSVINIAPGFPALPGETEDERLDRAFALTIAKNPRFQGRPSHDQDTATLPPRRFRDAWRKQGGAVGVDMPAARAIRAEELAQDLERRRSRAVKERAKATGARRQGWRNHLDALDAVELDLSAVATPEALAAFEPAWPVDPA